MLARAKLIAILAVATVAPLASRGARAQNETVKARSGAAPKTAAAVEAQPAASDALDRTKVLRAAADALGMVRWSDIGAGRNHLPAVDVANRMEIWGSGTTYVLDPSRADGPETAFKTDYHVALGYNPAAMRVEMTRTNSDGAAPQHTIRTVRDDYAWNESEIGAGLEPGRGTATPTIAAVRERLLQLWILPYGVVKAAIAAGDKSKVSTESGATVVTFPLSGQLGGITVKATLDAKNFVSKVETQTDNPAMIDLVIEADYSDYADRGEILSDLKFPGHIVQKQGGHPVLDIQVKKADLNNPYLIFPVPENVKKAAAQGPSR
jgi:hypothetical protein